MKQWGFTLTLTCGFLLAGCAAEAQVNPFQFIPVSPCRVVDTRSQGGPIQGGTHRDFIISGPTCGVPDSAGVYALNVAIIPQGSLSYLTVWPTGQPQPATTLTNSPDGRVKQNAAIAAAGTGGAVRVYASDTTNVVIDINGYFAPLPDPSALAFYPLTPCRVADTRNPPGPLGGPYLMGGVPRDFPVLEASACNIPNSAQAYSMNFAVLPRSGPLGYLTVWPTGGLQPVVSTLVDFTGTIVSNAAIVPAGAGGDISAYASNDTDLVIDINGYFAAPGPNGLSLWPPNPCPCWIHGRSSPRAQH